MKKLFLLIPFLLAGCGGGGDSDERAVRGVTDTSITFGIHTDLSGPLATWGVPTANGLRMRFEEANEAGGVHGRKLEVVVEDSQYQVPLAVKAVNKLVNVDDVFGIRPLVVVAVLTMQAFDAVVLALVVVPLDALLTHTAGVMRCACHAIACSTL